MQIIEAEVIDESHLKLLNPLETVPGSKIIRIIVALPEDICDDRESWFQLSLQNLEAAYGDDEPGYPAELIKETNPGFQV